ncbi:SOS response-associated peptidase family protein [uncultured Zobellia sp.]|uniref:SOS response-associated peptidase family protein n=1 Tax=uncultured Zobellia sp. TaxID=255433 RepID=UPI0025996A1D|nr:SOS response-associated peptidase family protein [uncultured Zobellia sp.]
MFNKLSIRAAREQIEDRYDAIFEFPDIYRPREIINGLEESTVPIISSKQQKTITTSIWGILPKKFEGDWGAFQKHVNTLTIPMESLRERPWFIQSEETERCLVIVTGFYTTFIADGELLFFHMTQESGEPFALAAICNELEDGFMTCALITQQANKTFAEVHNAGNQMPLILPEHQQQDWLDYKIPVTGIHTEETSRSLTAEAISEDFFENNISDAFNELSVLGESDFLPTPLRDLLFHNSIDLSNS